MTGFKSIQGKALFMLLTFTSSFLVVCHCPTSTAGAADHSCCCKKAAGQHPGDDRDACPATLAVKLHLAEKQVAAIFHPAPLAVPLSIHVIPVDIVAASCGKNYRDQDLYKHSPPDLQALYQRYLI